MPGCGIWYANKNAAIIIGIVKILVVISNFLSSNPGLFIHPRTLLPSLPTVTANDEIAAKIRHGQVVNLPELSRAREVKVFYGQRDLIAIATRIAGTLFHPKIVLG